MKDLSGKLNFHITMHEQPDVWLKEYLMTKEEFEVWEQLKTTENYIIMKESQHPALRFEDIVAHLFMQIVGYSKNVKDTVKISKSARQYANQATRKVCWNCRFYGMDLVLATEFAQRIRKEECHKNCNTCRVAKLIVFGTSFEDLVYWKGEGLISEYEDTMAKYAFKLMKIEQKYKKQRFINKKIIETKRKLAIELAELKAGNLSPYKLSGTAQIKFPNDYVEIGDMLVDELKGFNEPEKDSNLVPGTIKTFKEMEEEE